MNQCHLTYLYLFITTRSIKSSHSFPCSQVEVKNGVINTFSSIEKGEYNRLFDYVNQKKLRIKNRGKMVREFMLFRYPEFYLYSTSKLIRYTGSLYTYLLSLIYF